MNESRFVQAVSFARSGHKAEARALFQQLLKDDRANEMAWLWYAECFETPAERIQVLEMCIRINPHAQRVRIRLVALRRSEAYKNDPGRTQPVFINPPRETKKVSGTPPFIQAVGAAPFIQLEEKALTSAPAIFTIPPEHIPPEEFNRIEASIEGFLRKNSDIKPVWKAEAL